MLGRTLSISLLTAACAVGTAQAGTKLEMFNRDLSGSRTSTINTWAQDGMMRVETQPNQSVMIFKDGEVKEQVVGVTSKENLARLVERHAK